MSSIEELIKIGARVTACVACCPDCQRHSAGVHKLLPAFPMALPSSGRPVGLLLEMRRFRCPNPVCQRKTEASPLPLLLVPQAQRTLPVRDQLRVIGEVAAGEAGAVLSQRLAMTCSCDTLLR